MTSSPALPSRAQRISSRLTEPLVQQIPYFASEKAANLSANSPALRLGSGKPPHSPESKTARSASRSR